ncbi:MFS transporter [Amycolatopsis sp.]|uniref:MFS transporter n=1 Tax=Amycolatopsis sp. TaxID=37632 RepID=UPI002DFEC04C|nr:MFS transporter [Amycolatopsis sp.]
MLTLLKFVGYRRLLAADALSSLGDTMLLIVLGVMLKNETGSSSAAGLVALAMLLPNLAGPLLGAVADRFSRRRVLVTVSVVMVPVVLLVAVASGTAMVVVVYLVALGYGFAFVLIGSAQAGLVPHLVPEPMLGRANAAIRMLSEGARFLGPGIGVLVYTAAGGDAVAIIDAATFACAAILLARIPRQDRAPALPTSPRTDLMAGIKHLRRSPVLRRTVGAAMVAFATIGFLETAVFAVVTDGLGRPAAFVATFAVAQGACAIPAGLVAGAVMDRLGAVRTAAAGLGVFGVSAALLMVPVTPVAVAGAGIGAIGMTWFFIAFGTAIQQNTTDSVQGRAFGSARALVTAAQLVGIGVGAALGTAVDHRFLLAAIVLGCAGAFVLTWAPARAELAQARQAG